MNRQGKSNLGPVGEVVVGVPRSTPPFLVDVTSATCRTRQPAGDLRDLLACADDVAFGDLFSMLGHLRCLPPKSRDLTVEYSICNIGRSALRSSIPSMQKANDGRWEFNPFVRDLWRPASLLAREISTRGLAALYQHLEFPYLAVLFSASSRGVLVDAAAVRDSRNAASLLPLLQRRDLLSGRVRSPYRWSLPGRAFSVKPSLQNLDRAERRAVVAPPGHVLVYADYKAADLAALAGLSNDSMLLDCFSSGEDPHDLTAQLAAGSGTPDRAVGKLLNFLMLYGASTGTIARETGMTLEGAQRFEKKFWTVFSDAAAWRSAVSDQVMKPPHELRNPFGRLGCFPPDLLSDLVPEAIRRKALAFVVGSTASDIFKLNLVRLAETLPEGTHVLLPVHDAVLLEVPKEQVGMVVELCRSELVSPVPQIRIPLSVKIEVGKNWRDMVVA